MLDVRLFIFYNVLTAKHIIDKNIINIINNNKNAVKNIINNY